jgi:hypothetical protein
VRRAAERRLLFTHLASRMPSTIGTASAATDTDFRDSTSRPTRPLSTLRGHGRPCTANDQARLASDDGDSHRHRRDFHPGSLTRVQMLL